MKIKQQRFKLEVQKFVLRHLRPTCKHYTVAKGIIACCKDDKVSIFTATTACNDCMDYEKFKVGADIRK